MLTESYGGTCPNCGYDRMLVRYGRGGYFQYDACPNCAFALGEWYERNKEGHWDYKSDRDHEIWNTILEVERELIPLKEKSDFRKSLIEYMVWLEEHPDIEEIEHVFDYSNFDWTEGEKVC